jgi:hypothetical protein
VEEKFSVVLKAAWSSGLTSQGIYLDYGPYLATFAVHTIFSTILRTGDNKGLNWYLVNETVKAVREYATIITNDLYLQISHSFVSPSHP